MTFMALKDSGCYHRTPYYPRRSQTDSEWDIRRYSRGLDLKLGPPQASSTDDDYTPLGP
jgi:hypothetical protein